MTDIKLFETELSNEINKEGISFTLNYGKYTKLKEDIKNIYFCSGYVNDKVHYWIEIQNNVYDFSSILLNNIINNIEVNEYKNTYTEYMPILNNEEENNISSLKKITTKEEYYINIDKNIPIIKLNKKEMKILEKVIVVCNNNNIYNYYIMPPYYGINTIYKELNETSYYNILNEIKQESEMVYKTEEVKEEDEIEIIFDRVINKYKNK